jgi:hypothetical protein
MNREKSCGYRTVSRAYRAESRRNVRNRGTAKKAAFPCLSPDASNVRFAFQKGSAWQRALDVPKSAQLVEQGERYPRLTAYPIHYQRTLLDGVNDGQDELDHASRSLKASTRS